MQKQNSSWARVGWIGCWLLGTVFLGVVLYPIIRQWDHGIPHRAICQSNMKQLAYALQMYTDDYDNRFPTASGWQAGLTLYLNSMPHFICPSRTRVVPGYAYNLLLDRRLRKESLYEMQTPAFFESTLGHQDATDRLESFAKPHAVSNAKAGNVAFLDGHAKTLIAAPEASAGLKPVWQGVGGKR